MILKTILLSITLFSFIACGGGSSTVKQVQQDDSISKIPSNNKVIIPQNLK